jgi:acyl-coenzyme A thioesterase PaaI-like protein
VETGPYNHRLVIEPATHRAIDRRLCGRPVDLGPGRARVELLTVPEMAADEHGLVHGGFVFGCADYAAMLAVDHPLVVLSAAEVRFLKPVRVGETVVAEARLTEEDGRRRRVEVTVERAAAAGAVEAVFTGSFRCAVLDRHVLD